MAHAHPSDTPPAPSSSTPPKRWSRQQLLRSLEILHGLADPLPSTLPPSPPASRASSPAPSAKRKSDRPEPASTKRARTDSIASRLSSHPALSHRLSSQRPANEPSEDGELSEDPSSSHHPSSSSSSLPSLNSRSPTEILPLRRPKNRNTVRHHDLMHEQYHIAGRMLKYSGDARWWSTFPPTHKEYKALTAPPLPGSPYHRHAAVIAKLELVHALVCFTYALWNKDYKARSCNFEAWRTIDGFIDWCKTKWQVQAQDNISESEKAFLGLIWMIQSFIEARKAFHFTKSTVYNELDDKLKMAQAQVHTAFSQKSSDPSSLLSVKSESTPVQLPSPVASIAASSSANSTPTNREPTPIKSERVTPAPEPVVNAGPHIPHNLLPQQYQHLNPAVPPHISAAVNKLSIPFQPHLVGHVRDLAHSVKTAGNAATIAQQHLTLSTMARCFPKTFARMVYSSLNVSEEHEPNMEDDEGELLWPGQSVNGEGLGWVCLMGQAMISEFGVPYGYQGLNGVVPKPETFSSSQRPRPAASTVPHGQTSSPAPHR